MQGYSLLDNLESIGILPESILKKISSQVLLAFEEYNDKFKEDYGELCVCDILFDKDGNIKVK
jgi:hypothetical protein